MKIEEKLKDFELCCRDQIKNWENSNDDDYYYGEEINKWKFFMNLWENSNNNEKIIIMKIINYYVENKLI
jgi:hypothetical protein